MSISRPLNYKDIKKEYKDNIGLLKQMGAEKKKIDDYERRYNTCYESYIKNNEDEEALEGMKIIASNVQRDIEELRPNLSESRLQSITDYGRFDEEMDKLINERYSKRFASASKEINKKNQRIINPEKLRDLEDKQNDARLKEIAAQCLRDAAKKLHNEGELFSVDKILQDASEAFKINETVKKIVGDDASLETHIAKHVDKGKKGQNHFMGVLAEFKSEEKQGESQGVFAKFFQKKSDKVTSVNTGDHQATVSKLDKKRP